jgi:hypothetical protein
MAQIPASRAAPRCAGESVVEEIDREWTPEWGGTRESELARNVNTTTLNAANGAYNTVFDAIHPANDTEMLRA